MMSPLMFGCMGEGGGGGEQDYFKMFTISNCNFMFQIMCCILFKSCGSVIFSMKLIFVKEFDFLLKNYGEKETKTIHIYLFLNLLYTSVST